MIRRPGPCSHLDTVPNGDRFDGALGVLVAFEALQTIKESGIDRPCHLEAISFTDEEGTISGLLGSHALTGDLTESDLTNIRSTPAEFAAGLKRHGLTHHSLLTAGRDPASLAGYVELHIEQGTRLEEAGMDIGIVTSIVGIRAFWLRFEGRAGHAGTTRWINGTMRCGGQRHLSLRPERWSCTNYQLGS